MARWALKRDLFLGGNRYRQQEGGTEIPDTIGSGGEVRKVVPWREDRKYKDDEVPMPRDAELFEEGKKYAGRADRRIIGESGKPEPIALSQLPKHAQAQEAAANQPNKK